MNHYTHLTIDEREKARVLLELGFSLRAIARKLNRAVSTISREIRRNQKKNGEYVAHIAQKKSNLRKRKCGRNAVLATDSVMRAYVLERLTWCWTPEQIAGRAKLENQPFSFSFVTIYRAIDAGVLPKKLKKIMRFKRKYKKHKSTDLRGKIQGTTSIHERPAGANDRSELGHWESDTVLGSRNTGCFATHVERKTGFLVACYLPQQKSAPFNTATTSAFEKLPKACKKSFTTDNGKEFTNHQKLKQFTGMDVYFCDPYSPWQRGLNENTNGLLRQFFPKRSSFANMNLNFLQAIVSLINHRPRKRFGFLSPIEMLHRHL